MRPPGVRAAALPAWEALRTALFSTDEPVPCRNDPDAWFSDDPDVREYAAAHCWSCPVLAECGRFATANQETAGVWAGMDRTRSAGRPARPKETRTA